jgi:hypothetical protein
MLSKCAGSGGARAATAAAAPRVPRAARSATNTAPSLIRQLPHRQRWGQPQLSSRSSSAGAPRSPQAAAAAAVAGGAQHAAAAAAHPSDPSFAPLTRWLESSGGRVSGLDLRPCAMGPALMRGLVATAAAAEGAALLSVPLSRALRDDRVPPAYPGAIWSASVAAYLLEEAAKGAASEWAPYIASLPGGGLLSGSSSDGGSSSSSSAADWPAGMLLLTEAQVEAVQYAPALAALKAFQQQARGAYEAWRHAAGASSSTAAAGCPWERFALALHLVQSRSIRLAITGCRVMIPGD